MQVLKTTVPDTMGQTGRIVHVFLGSELMALTADWEGPLQAGGLFCSAVWCTPPPGRLADLPRALLHPDDRPALEQQLRRLKEGASTELSFRIITTYGEVRQLQTGGPVHGFRIDEDFEAGLLQAGLDALVAQQEAAHHRQRLEWLHLAAELAQGDHRTGFWYTDLSTLETHYSDSVFRIYGLPPGSLNAHPHTFYPFIHPEDRPVVLDIIDQAFSEHLPLDLEFRLLRNDGQERRIAYATRWTYSADGRMLQTGTIREISSQSAAEEELLRLRRQLQLRELQLQQAERMSRTGNWSIGLRTRRTQFSDQCYRLLGLRPGSVPAGLGLFTRFAHPDDQRQVVAAIGAILSQGVIGHLEFRIQRPDGKLRYLRQAGQVIDDPVEGKVVAGTIEDITDWVLKEQKLEGAERLLQQQQDSQAALEELAGTGVWTFDPQAGGHQWSVGLYRLLQKPASVPPSIQTFVELIHPEDQDEFRARLDLALHSNTPADIGFRLLRRGEQVQLKASFRIQAEAERPFVVIAFQDLTAAEQHRSRALQQAALAEQLADRLDDRILSVDPELNVTSWNRACETAYGVRRNAALGKNLFELIPQLQRPDILAAVHETILAGQGRGTRVTDVRGRVVVEVSIFPLLDSAGRPGGGLFRLCDISDRHQQRQQLLQRQRLIDCLGEHSRDAIIVLDRHMNYLYWNPRSEVFFGLRKEALLGRNILEVFPDASPFTFKDFRRAIKGEQIKLGENSESLEPYKAEALLVPVRDEQEEVTALLWLVRESAGPDTNTGEATAPADYQGVRRQLREQARYVESMLDTSMDRILVFDRNLQVTAWNSKCEQFYGRRKEEVLGQKMTDLFPKLKNFPDMMEAMERALGGNYVALPARPGMYHSGFTEAFYIPLRNGTDEVVGVLNILHDVSALVESEQKMKELNDILERRNRELQDKHEEITSFAFIASHDLREPLRKIHTFADLLLQREADTLSQPGQELVHKIQRSTQRLEHLIQDVLVLTKIHSDREERTPVNLNKLFQKLEKSLQPEIRAAGVTISRDELPVLMAVSNQLFHLFKNLLDNAIKYRHPDRPCRIEVGCVPMELQEGEREGVPGGHYLCVTITDNGIGFEPRYKNKIFQIFQQVHNRPEQDGTGIGLSICKKIIENHDGYITAESEPGAGAVFYCFFPSRDLNGA